MDDGVMPRTAASLKRLAATWRGLVDELRRAQALKLLSRYQRHHPEATRYDLAVIYEACKAICGVRS